jgi:hypothetical protein
MQGLKAGNAHPLVPPASSVGRPPPHPTPSSFLPLCPSPYPRPLPPLRPKGATHDSLQEMGRRLACEIAEALAPLARHPRRPLRKVSLVGEWRGAEGSCGCACTCAACWTYQAAVLSTTHGKRRRASGGHSSPATVTDSSHGCLPSPSHLSPSHLSFFLSFFHRGVMTRSVAAQKAGPAGTAADLALPLPSPLCLHPTPP